MTVWPEPEPTILIIVGSNTHIITLGCTTHIIHCTVTFKSSPGYWIVSTQGKCQVAGDMPSDVLRGRRRSGDWLETGDSDSDDARAGAGSILLHNSGLIWTGAINNLNFVLLGLQWTLEITRVLVWARRVSATLTVVQQEYIHFLFIFIFNRNKQMQ